MADWDSTGHVVTQTRCRAFQTLDRAFDFLLRFQKLGQVFGKLVVSQFVALVTYVKYPNLDLLINI